MILQALVKQYEALADKGQIAPPGWSLQKVSYALHLDRSGDILQIIPLITETPREKKTVLAPQELPVPAPVKRTAGVVANFLCDHSGYILGADNKGKPERTADCFKACRVLHEAILADTASLAAQAVLAYFASWNPEKASVHPALKDLWDELVNAQPIQYR